MMKRKITFIRDEDSQVKLGMPTGHSIDEESLHVRSTEADATGKSWVTMAWGEKVGKLAPEQARQLALEMIEAAKEAETDSLLSRVLNGADEESRPGIEKVLKEMRRWREMQNFIHRKKGHQ